MTSRIQKWGNSLALRIPKAFAIEAGIDENSLVNISIESGKLVVAPTYEEVPRLDDLVAQITDENRHDEIRPGPSVGNEAW